MPPRKSDQRKSDVSFAKAATPDTRAANDGDDNDDAAASAHSPGAAQSQDTSQITLEKKGKDKDREKEKEKDKDKDKDAVTLEDLTLPKSIITRLAKGVLPPNTQIQANAILAISKSTTVFISYLAAHANENTVNANKKTVSPADVFKALDDTEFAFLKEPLEAEFAKFNAIQTEKRTSYRQKVRVPKPPSGDDTDMADVSHADTTVASESSTAGPRSKKQRVDPEAPSAAAEEEDADTEEEPDAEDDDEDDDDDVEEEEDEQEDDGEEGQGSGDETQDALEETHSRDDGDEALDGDESD